MLDCSAYIDDGVVAHWEMRSAGVVSGSQYKRSAHGGGAGTNLCSEKAGVDIQPAAVRDLAGLGMGDAVLRGPPCTVGTEWESESAFGSSINVKTMLVNNGMWEAMQMDGGGVNTGLYVGEVESLVASGLLPTDAVSIEVWLTTETDLSGRSSHRGGQAGHGATGLMGVAGAMQKSREYEKGWGLSHWSDHNRGDVWYVAFDIAVEANNNQFHDYDSAANPGLRAGASLSFNLN